MAATVREKRRKGKLVAYFVDVRYKGQRARPEFGLDKAAAEQFAVLVRRRLASARAMAHPPATLQDALRGEEAAPTTVPTLNDYYRHWFARNAVPGGWARGTWQDIRSAYQSRILPELGDFPLDAITRPVVKDWLAKLARKEGLATKTLAKYKGYLSSLITSAVDDGDVPGLSLNPLIQSRGLLPAVRTQRRRIEVWSVADIERILDVAERVAPEGYPVLLTLARTGMRIGEAFGLRETDLLESGYAQIDQQVTRGEIRQTKGASYREVEIPTDLDTALRRQLARNKRARLKLGIQTPFVFFGDAGQPLDADNFRTRVWYEVIRHRRLNGVVDRGLHGFRHAWISHLLMAGERPFVVSKMAGHASIRITTDRYGHFIPGGRRITDALPRRRL